MSVICSAAVSEYLNLLLSGYTSMPVIYCCQSVNTSVCCYLIKPQSIVVSGYLDLLLLENISMPFLSAVAFNDYPDLLLSSSTSICCCQGIHQSVAVICYCQGIPQSHMLRSVTTPVSVCEYLSLSWALRYSLTSTDLSPQAVRLRLIS